MDEKQKKTAMIAGSVVLLVIAAVLLVRSFVGGSPEQSKDVRDALKREAELKAAAQEAGLDTEPPPAEEPPPDAPPPSRAPQPRTGG